MRRTFSSTLLALLLTGAMILPVCADAIADTPIDRMGEAGGPLLIILVLVVLPLALIIGVVALTIFLIKKLVKKLKKK